MRTIAQEKIWVNKKTNFHYIVRGIEKTPPGTIVRIVSCNSGIVTSDGTLKGTTVLGLRNISGKFAGQMIAWSYDPDDLILFAIEQGWDMDDEAFRELRESLLEDTAQTPPKPEEAEGS